MAKSKLIAKFSFVKTDFLFVLIFIVFAAFYYDSVLEKGPLNSHLWRQTDCLSIAHHYAEGANFFSPEMHIQLSDDNTTGRTAGEFPILYFIVGMLWKLLGESYLVYRLFYLLILFAGLFSFYKSLRILFNDSYWAIVISLLLFTSPVYVVYGISFLTDVPAISFVLIALYFLLQYYRKKLLKLFYVSMGFFALAGLIKVSSLIAFIFLFIILIIESFSIKSLENRKLFNRPKYEWIGFISVILLVFTWYYYANYYNSLHKFWYTFNNVYPFWRNNDGEFEYLAMGIKNFTSTVFFSRPILYAFLFIGIVNLSLWKKIPLLAYLSNIIIIFGSILYFILWMPLMGNHDYYYSALLILFGGILVPFVWFIKANYLALFKGYRLKIFLGIFLVFNFLYCLNVTKLKTLAQQGTFIMVGNHEFVSEMKLTNLDFSVNWKRFEQMRPYIRSIGIKKEDKIISFPDKSLNTSLYLLNQKGWTNFISYDKEGIEKLIDKGAKYLFISDEKLLNEEYLTPFLSDQIGTFKDIKVYMLSKKSSQNETLTTNKKDD